jgi:hypothetical protein
MRALKSFDGYEFAEACCRMKATSQSGSSAVGGDAPLLFRLVEIVVSENDFSVNVPT